jgi:hypothetical protein
VPYDVIRRRLLVAATAAGVALLMAGAIGFRVLANDAGPVQAASVGASCAHPYKLKLVFPRFSTVWPKRDSKGNVPSDPKIRTNYARRAVMRFSGAYSPVDKKVPRTPDGSIDWSASKSPHRYLTRVAVRRARSNILVCGLKWSPPVRPRRFDRTHRRQRIDVVLRKSGPALVVTAYAARR